MSQSIQIQVTQVGLEQSIAAAMKRVGSSSQINLGTSSKQINALSQPLGRITGQADEFSKSMAAANARVLAFGASAGIIAGVSKAMSGLVTSTIKVEKSLVEINSVLNKTGAELDKFGQDIFNVAKNTGKSFDEVASGALELARQGLNAEDTLARLNDALILSRLSGLDAAQSVEGLTAAFNSFQKSGITTAEILNKVVAVSQKYAVSERDIIEGVKRSASVAQQAGVSFDELAAVITAVQQTTARGGAVIGNSFKTIFARIQRKDVLSDLQNMGVAVTDLQGNVLPALRILENLAGQLNNFSQIEQANIAEKLGGVFQLDKLLSALKDLSSEASVTRGALKAAGEAGNSAYQKNIVLNQTLASLLNKVAVNAEQLGAKLGEIGVTDSLKNVLGFFNNLLEGIQGILGEESGLGNLVRGLVKGLGSFLAGPGLALFAGIILKLSKDLVQFGFASLKAFFGIGKAAKEVQNVEGAISQILAKNVNLQQQLFALEGNRAAQLRVITAALVEQEAVLRRSSKISSGLAAPLYNVGARATGSGLRIGNSADGYMPAVAKESKAIKQGVGGARSGDRPVVMPNFNFGGGKKGTMVAHTGEYVVPNFNGSGGTAVFNRQMVQSMGLPSGAKKINAAGGLVPNFASGYSLSSFAGARINNYRARTQFSKNKNKNIEPDDKISTVGFGIEKIPIPEELQIALKENKQYLGRNPTDAFELIAIKYLRSKGLLFKLGSRSLFSETSSSVDGYNFNNVSNKEIGLLEVKSGYWNPLEVGNKFGRFLPENVTNDRADISSKINNYFTEGVKEQTDVIKLKNTLAVPDTEKGRSFIRKDKNKNEILSYSGFRTKSIATAVSNKAKKTQIENAVNAVGGFIPNFAPKFNAETVRKYANEIEKYKLPTKDFYQFPDGTGGYGSQIKNVLSRQQSKAVANQQIKEKKIEDKGFFNLNADALGGILLVSPRFGKGQGSLDTSMQIGEIPFFNQDKSLTVDKNKYIKLAGIKTSNTPSGRDLKSLRADVNELFSDGIVKLAYRLYGETFDPASGGEFSSKLQSLDASRKQQLLPPAAQGDLFEAAGKVALNSFANLESLFGAGEQNRPFDFQNPEALRKVFGVSAKRGEAKRGGEKNFSSSKQVQGIIKKIFNDSEYGPSAVKSLRSQGAFNLSEAQKAAQAGNAFSGYIPNFAQIGQFIGSGQESDVFRKGNRVIKYSKGDQRQASEKAQLNKAMNWAAAKNQLLNIYPNLRILQNQQRGAATIQPFAGETGRKVIKDKLKAFKLSDLIDRKFEEARSKNSAQPNWLSPLFFDSDPGNFTFLNGVKGDVNSASVEEIFNANKFGLIDMGVLPLRLPDIKKRAAGGFIPNFASPLQAAVGREMAAGVPVSQIYIDKSPALKNAANPMGLMVANRRDEPAGGFQGINRARREGANPMMYGAASGFVPNYAPQIGQVTVPSSSIRGGAEVSKFNDELKRIALEMRKNNMSYTQAMSAMQNFANGLTLNASQQKRLQIQGAGLIDAYEKEISARNQKAQQLKQDRAENKKASQNSGGGRDVLGVIFAVQGAMSALTGATDGATNGIAKLANSFGEVAGSISTAVFAGQGLSEAFGGAETKVGKAVGQLGLFGAAATGVYSIFQEYAKYQDSNNIGLQKAAEANLKLAEAAGKAAVNLNTLNPVQKRAVEKRADDLISGARRIRDNEGRTIATASIGGLSMQLNEDIKSGISQGLGVGVNYDEIYNKFQEFALSGLEVTESEGEELLKFITDKIDKIAKNASIDKALQDVVSKTGVKSAEELKSDNIDFGVYDDILEKFYKESGITDEKILKENVSKARSALLDASKGRQNEEENARKEAPIQLRNTIKAIQREKIERESIRKIDQEAAKVRYSSALAIAGIEADLNLSASDRAIKTLEAQAALEKQTAELEAQKTIQEEINKLITEFAENPAFKGIEGGEAIAREKLNTLIKDPKAQALTTIENIDAQKNAAFNTATEALIGTSLEKVDGAAAALADELIRALNLQKNSNQSLADANIEREKGKQLEIAKNKIQEQNNRLSERYSQMMSARANDISNQAIQSGYAAQLKNANVDVRLARLSRVTGISPIERQNEENRLNREKFQNELKSEREQAALNAKAEFMRSAKLEENILALKDNNTFTQENTDALMKLTEALPINSLSSVAGADPNLIPNNQKGRMGFSLYDIPSSQGTAADRYHNIGGSYPYKGGLKYGMMGEALLKSKDGEHPIGVYPNDVAGAAATMDKLRSLNPVGRTVQEARNMWVTGKWNQQTTSKLPGIHENEVIRDKQLNDPQWMKQFVRSTGLAEGFSRELSPADLDQAFSYYKAGGIGPQAEKVAVSSVSEEEKFKKAEELSSLATEEERLKAAREYTNQLGLQEEAAKNLQDRLVQAASALKGGEDAAKVKEQLQDSADAAKAIAEAFQSIAEIEKGDLQNQLAALKASPLTFSQGMENGFLQMQVDSQQFAYSIGKDIPKMFADGMSNAINSAIEGTASLKDALRSAAYEFVKGINQKIMSNLINSAVGNFGTFAFGKGMASGGKVTGGSGQKDDVPAMLMGGEYVVNKKAVSKYGPQFLEAINNGTLSGYAKGGKVPNQKGPQGNFYTPGTYGMGAIEGKKNLLDFATQTGTSGQFDRIVNESGYQAISLEPESSRLSVSGMRNTPMFEATQSAKQQAFDLYLQQYNAEIEAKKQAKAQRKALTTQLLMLAGSAAIGGIGKAAMTGGTNAVKALGSGAGLLDKVKAFSGGLYKGGDIGGGIMGGGLKNLFSGNFGLAYQSKILKASPVSRAIGGMIPSTSGIDTVPAMLSGGEFVMNRSAVQSIGATNLQSMNSGGTSVTSEETSKELNEKLLAKLDELIKVSDSSAAGNITINVSPSGQTTQEGSQDASANRQQLARQIKDAVLQVINEEKRIGGSLRR